MKANNCCRKGHASILCTLCIDPFYMAGGNDERSPLLQNGQANGHEDRGEEVVVVLSSTYEKTRN